MRITLVSFLFFFITTICAQINPGNIGASNLSAWFKATDLEIGADVETWPTSHTNTGSPIVLEDSNAPFSYATDLGLYSNYNNAVSFAGNNGDQQRVLEKTELLDLLDNSTEGATGTFFAAYYLPESNSCTGCHVVNYREGGGSTADGIQFRVKIGTQNGRLAIGSGNSFDGSADFMQDFRPDIISYKGNKSGESTMNSYRRSLAFSEGGSSGTTGNTGLYLGARRFNGNYNAYFDGLIYEIIFYDRDLSEVEISKVHTYLAVKHGITLDNTGGENQGDYISTNGSVVWDADFEVEYHNEIIGIAYDGAEGLLQLQSHTFMDTSRIYLDEIANGNASNLGAFLNTGSYVMIGNNQGAMCGTASSNLEIPVDSDIIERVEREWKVTNTNYADEINLDFKVNSCIDLNSIDPLQLRFLVDDDGDFTNTEVYTIGASADLSIEDGYVKIKDIVTQLIPINETRFVTIAISSSISNNEEIGTDKFSIYPNPANDYFVVKTQVPNAKIGIYNALGQIVLHKELKNAADAETVIDISEFPRGTYLINLGNQYQTLIK
ncbi:T9SS type A sorting domain-containing protein [Saprospiraceae bacterium]|nr:T9SS type A sorting domain-containing protein [Saprospiraceae bacterium]